HDLRLVRSSEIPRRAALQSNRRELADRLLRILFSSSGKPHRLLRIHRRATQDHSGSDHSHRLRCLLSALPEAAPALELSSRLRPDRRRRRRHFQKVGTIYVARAPPPAMSAKEFTACKVLRKSERISRKSGKLYTTVEERRF